MAKFCFLLLLLALVVPTSEGADDPSSFAGQVICVSKSWGPKPLNGHPTSVLVYDFRDVRDDDYTLTLDLDVEVASDFPRIDAAEVQIEALDERGRKIEVRTKLKQFESSHQSQVGVYDLRLKRGQKVGTIKVMWKGSEQVFPMSKVETFETTISS